MIRDKFIRTRTVPFPDEVGEAGWNLYSQPAMKPLQCILQQQTFEPILGPYLTIRIPANSWALNKILYLEQLTVQQLNGMQIPTGVISEHITIPTSLPPYTLGTTPAVGGSSESGAIWKRRLLTRLTDGIHITDYSNYGAGASTATFDSSTNDTLCFDNAHEPDYTQDFNIQFTMVGNVGFGVAFVGCLFAQAYLQAPYYLGRAR